MSSEHQNPATTREFLAQWNDTVEEHLVRQLTDALPALSRGSGLEGSAPTAVLARHLVRALRLSASSGDPAVGLRYLSESARAGETEPSV